MRRDVNFPERIKLAEEANDLYLEMRKKMQDAAETIIDTAPDGHEISLSGTRLLANSVDHIKAGHSIDPKEGMSLVTMALHGLHSLPDPVYPVLVAVMQAYAAGYEDATNPSERIIH